MAEPATLEALEAWIGGLLARLEPDQRRRLLQVMARDLRTANVGRIRRQVNPDGSRYAPRSRPPLRDKSGTIRRRSQAMFQKLRKPKFLSARATADEATVGFENPQVSRIAGVHQYGLRDRVRRLPGATEVQYPVRQLLGFAAEDPERMMDLLLAHLAD